MHVNFAKLKLNCRNTIIYFVGNTSEKFRWNFLAWIMCVILIINDAMKFFHSLRLTRESSRSLCSLTTISRHFCSTAAALYSLAWDEFVSRPFWIASFAVFSKWLFNCDSPTLVFIWSIERIILLWKEGLKDRAQLLVVLNDIQQPFWKQSSNINISFSTL